MITLVQGDIVYENVDAIVNAANSGLAGGAGVDGAIHDGAGAELDRACMEIIRRIGGTLAAGNAVITPGFDLQAKWIIHAVGPIYRGGTKGEADALASCYRESIVCARDKQLHSIAFPAISTGVYRYPAAEAAEIAISTVAKELPSLGDDAEAVFVLFDRTMFDLYVATARRLLPKGSWCVRDPE